MEDENSIELSLGLGYGGSTSKAKGKSTDFKATEGGTMKQTVGRLNIGQQNHDFWNDLGQKPSGDSDAVRYCELWVSDTKLADVPDEKSGYGKRKMTFEDLDTDSVKRPETGGTEVDSQQKNSSCVALKHNGSSNLENDSLAENETVVESEGGASAPWLVSKHGDISNTSEKPNFSDKHLTRYSTLLSPQGNEPCSASVREPCPTPQGNLAYGPRLSLQPLEATSVQSTGPSKGSNAASTIDSSRVTSLIMSPSTVNDDYVNSTKSSDLQLAFGYPSIQLPTLETGSSWMLSSKDVLGVSTAERQDLAEAVPDAVCPEGNNAHHEEAVRRPLGEDESKDTTPAPRSLEIASPALSKGFTHEGSVIRPGAAPGLKIGGCGSFPDLPWVSVTGAGPNGKTISGVTYKFSKSQIKIVCACHGSHMSPEEFIQHANVDTAEVENTALSSFPSGNPATSAQS